MNQDSGQEPPSHLPLNKLDLRVQRIFNALFVQWREPTVAATWFLYSIVFIIHNPWLGVSANYLVILPVIVTAMANGLTGGFIAGSIALPANLVLFALLGHMEDSPDNWIMAELSGITLGLALGYLSDYFIRLDQEFKRRQAVEAQLIKALEEKQTLLGEVHHRVKNNLATIKSMVQLQLFQSEDSHTQEAGKTLIRRIMALSLVHEQLCNTGELSHMDPGEYLKRLCHNISVSLASPHQSLQLHIDSSSEPMDIDTVVALGLIVNEIVCNSFKHARPSSTPLQVQVSFYRKDSAWKLAITDNGQGMPAEACSPGMGMLFVETLAANLDAGLVRPGPGESTWELCSKS